MSRGACTSPVSEFLPCRGCNGGGYARKNGHEHRLIDLYRSGFDPRLTASERAGYYGNFDKTALEKEIDDLQWAESIILVFPTWWFGPPAILKGWFDRVWAPSIAYDHATDLGSIKPRLSGLRKVVAFTTLGSPWWADYFILRRPVRRVLKTAILGACAPQASLKFISFYRAERIGDKVAESSMDRVRAAIDRL
jgi:NAD(P)H dehydrogenase (quinone)